MDSLAKRYQKRISKINAADKDKDFETAHMIEDDTLNMFIRDIASGKIDRIVKARVIAKMLMEHLDKDNERWYA
jgi:hypothetical protein